MTTSQQSDDRSQSTGQDASPEAEQAEARPAEGTGQDAQQPQAQPAEGTGQDASPEAEQAEAQPAEGASPEAEQAEAQPAEGTGQDAQQPQAQPGEAEAPSAAPAGQAPKPGGSGQRAGAPKPGRPKPGGPRVAGAPQPSGTPAPVAAPPTHTTPLEEAARFARVTDDGHVFVLIHGEEHPVGQYPDATRDEALAYFVRKYDDVVSQLMLLEQRVLAKAPTADMGKALDHLQALVDERAMVGDIPALQDRIESARQDVAELQSVERKLADARRSEDLAAREAIVAEAEELAGRDPGSMQWKQGSTRMNELFESWKAAQKGGVRLGKSTEDALWKRFRAARTTFDRHRRAFFSQLDADNAEAKAAKEELIARAEALSTSTDWGRTSSEYRRLMDEWKTSKRASRKDDDALWARFRAAQDVFFNARNQAHQAMDEEFGQNLKAKEAILEEARALLPVTDPAAARKALGPLRDRWEAAGKVPRSAMQRMEQGMRQIEDAVKAAEDEQWRRTNPETKARTNSMLEQLEDTIGQLESDLEEARAAGDSRRIEKAQEALDARRTWLETLRRSAADFS